MASAWLALAPLVALAVDRRAGEPPVRWHPVAWMGRALGSASPFVAPHEDDAAVPSAQRQFFAGAACWIAIAAVVTAIAAAVQALVVLWLPAWAAAPVLGLLLKPLLAWRMLRDEVRAVETALADSLDAGRARLGRLVSRDVARLSAAEVRESAIESLAENLNDSVVAPLFWFAAAGLPGAALYRFANTADAMWGYKGSRDARVWKWAGKWAARADDALSWLPARATAALILLLAAAPRAAWRALPAEARRTPSPNGGWPMGAMALALRIRLAKPGVYVLNGDGDSPVQRHTPLAIAVAGRAAAAAGLLAVLGAWLA
ncbi:adenosylcobinamide-phosphate synthase CbiB [Xylophilus sp.]|uniref:adenosylcobinamide-phosphate synthase CbiB n=1 Tax=Xylophilus sp. TaxID=2653893 RepID=UPI0013BB171A|nr:adenosylcobinamide-phosphate synthase CbiB [Xylophilus sp.]KAF1049221.1 MAG: Cobalamin biosynthesis protein CobD [Xylophilus sp.]